MPTRFSPARGAGSITLSSLVRGPQGNTGATGATGAQGVAGDQSVDTRTALASTQVPVLANYITTMGYAAVGDGGGALYKRVGSEPAHGGKVQSADGAWWELVADGQDINVRMFGAKLDNVTDDAAACIAACAFLQATGGGTLYLTAGDLRINSAGFTTAGTYGIHVKGEVYGSTFLRSLVDITLITIAGSSSASDFSVFGKGIGGDTGTFGATQPAMIFNGDASGYIRDLRIWGGSAALSVTGNDTHITNVDAGNSYGLAAVTTTGSNFYNHGKFDHAPTATTPLTALPYPARANTTAYIVGDVVVASSYALVCKTAGTSGGSTPTLKNYGIDITDGTVTWELLAPEGYGGIAVLGAALENRFLHTDFTGSGYAHSFSVDAADAFTELTDCVFNSQVTLTNGKWTVIKGCVLGDPVHISGCVSTGTVNISVAANKDDFHIVDNDLGGGTITVAAGTSNDYTISGNTNATIADGGTGTRKHVRAVSVPSSFSVNKGGTDQTGIVSATFTAITWGNEVYDIGSKFASNGWTPEAGNVELTCSEDFSGTITAGALCALAIFKDGVSYKQKTVYAPVANAGGASITVEDRASGTNVYTARIFVTTSAGTATVAGGIAQTFFQGHWKNP
jgi:hypothetical protein